MIPGALVFAKEIGEGEVVQSRCGVVESIRIAESTPQTAVLAAAARPSCMCTTGPQKRCLPMLRIGPRITSASGVIRCGTTKWGHMHLRTWVKEALPWWLSCAIARAINRPWLEEEHRTERLAEYSWVLAEIGKHHPYGSPILDIGSAGGYFDEALCHFGPVTGVDPKRDQPVIAHPSYRHEWPLSEGVEQYGTVVSVSTLEHLMLAEELIGQMLTKVVEGGQLLFTVPVGPEAHQYTGYRLWTVKELCGLAAIAPMELTVFARREAPRGHYWQRLSGQECGGQEGQGMDVSALLEHLPESLEHQVNAVAAVRLVHRALPPASDE